MKISAAIITFNEEKNIRRCLTSLSKVAEEIVVIDSFSQDGTKTICSEFENVNFIENPFGGHIQQKNYAIDCCSNNWVLSLDADEELSPELESSILEVKSKLKNDDQGAYRFNRLSNYCGQWIHFGGWYPDTKTRLFHKQIGTWGGENPHDKYLVQPNVPHEFLNGDLLHYTFHTVEQHRAQIDKFTSIAAKAKFEKGKKSNTLLAIVKALAKWIRNFLVKKGYRDGRVGYQLANASAYATYLRYKKLADLWKA
jgi:glycosyltransferase involved in cell wall biosynthesis